MNHGRPQGYGTQVTCIGEELGPAPLNDPEHVDKRWASVVLGPLQEYLDSFPDGICDLPPDEDDV